MATYVIGDVQGCYTSLQLLLNKIRFNSRSDELWFTGDLVNRGKDSLLVCQFIMSLGHQAKTVLGNHDIYLLALANGCLPNKENSLNKLLASPDLDKIINWLRQQPLIYTQGNYVLVHAGIPPIWSIETAKRHAKEVENLLKQKNYQEYLLSLWGDKPDTWSEDLEFIQRCRFTVNALTRMRYCRLDGSLDLQQKENSANIEGLIPWFDVPNPALQNHQILFGHFASLYNQWDEMIKRQDIIALDSGCVWGNELTAYCLETKQRVTVACKE